MKLNILLFGVTKDILGTSSYHMALEGETVLDLKNALLNDFPKLVALNSLLIAVNNEYAEDNLILNEKDEIALIPPVSGG
jgi:molybdopterin converting factor subunit 1